MYTYAYVHIYIHTHTNIHTHKHTCVCVCVCVFVHSYIHIFMYTYIHIYSYRYINKYIHCITCRYMCITHVHVNKDTHRRILPNIRRAPAKKKKYQQIYTETQRGVYCAEHAPEIGSRCHRSMSCKKFKKEIKKNEYNNKIGSRSIPRCSVVGMCV